MDAEKFIGTIRKWMKAIRLPVAESYLREKLQAHPDFPSLLSITDTLDDLKIENISLVVDKEKFHEIPVPFLVHTVNKGGGFALVHDTNKILKDRPEFLEQWDGVAIVAEKPEVFNHLENEKFLIKEKRNHQTYWLTGILLICVSFLTIVNSFNWISAGVLISTLTGIGIGILIVQHELGITNEFTEKLCHAGKNTDCDAVMHSRAGKLSKWMNWADAGIIYFGSYLLLFIFLSYSSAAGGLSLLAIISAASIPFTLFSIYYQWRVVKKWCTLCLLTVAVLWLQFFLLVPGTLNLVQGYAAISFSANNFIFAILVFAIISTSWLFLGKPVLKKNAELTEIFFPLLRFKNNPEIFYAFLRQQRQVDITPFKDDLQIGNPGSPVQIMVACNPYCGPCAAAHKVLHELTEMTNVGLTIRLSVKADNEKDNRTIAGKYLMELAYNGNHVYKRRLLEDWYELMNMEKFKDKHPLTNEADVQYQLEQHEKWMKEAKIEVTPTIFINGYQLPKQYKVTDLKNILRRTENTGTENEKTDTKNILALV